MNDYADVSTLDTSTDGGGWGASEAPPGLLGDPAQPDPAQPDPAQSAGGGLLPMPADLSGSIPGDGDGFGGLFSPSAFSARAASAMSLSPAGAAFIKSYEQGPKGGVATRQYPSPEGGSDTIGWGHKIQPGENFSGGITAAAGDRLFDADSIKHQRIVQSQVKVPLTPNQYDALTDLAYNLPAAFSSEKHSTLLRLLNQGNYTGAAAEFARWNHIGKAVSPGLTKRRAGETNIFLNGTYVNHR